MLHNVASNIEHYQRFARAIGHSTQHETRHGAQTKRPPSRPDGLMGTIHNCIYRDTDIRNGGNIAESLCLQGPLKRGNARNPYSTEATLFRFLFLHESRERGLQFRLVFECLPHPLRKLGHYETHRPGGS